MELAIPVPIPNSSVEYEHDAATETFSAVEDSDMDFSISPSVLTPNKIGSGRNSLTSSLGNIKSSPRQSQNLDSPISPTRVSLFHKFSNKSDTPPREIEITPPFVSPSIPVNLLSGLTPERATLFAAFEEWEKLRKISVVPDNTVHILIYIYLLLR